MIDTTAALKEIIEGAHAILEFGDMDAARTMAARFIELNAALTCAGLTGAGVTPMPWRPFGEYRPAVTTSARG